MPVGAAAKAIFRPPSDLKERILGRSGFTTEGNLDLCVHGTPLRRQEKCKQDLVNTWEALSHAVKCPTKGRVSKPSYLISNLENEFRE